MRIAILGTRGIPNNYGGFEQFAEYLSEGLLKSGHEVFVYTSHDHTFQESHWNGVNLIHKYNPEKTTGTIGQFLYDLFCIIDSRKRKFDIILQLGYTSSSVWGRLLPSKSVIITNMDGLEWKRTKYNRPVQRFLLYAEKLAVKTSHYLVADSLGIKSYLKNKYNRDSEFMPYGANIFDSPAEKAIESYHVKPYQYNMLIARMEPENNIEVILDGAALSVTKQPILVIGNTSNSFGKYLTHKFENEKHIRFLGSNYDMGALNNLRYYSHLYFHGHSVGGTNPSLLEAMGSGALVCAHNNEFNASILGSDAFYFSVKQDVKALLDSKVSKANYSAFLENNLEKIRNFYSWPKIVNDYENFFVKVTTDQD